MKVTIGCDPEFTILGPTGLPVPAHKVGIRDKTEKHEASYYGTFFRDGYNVEANVTSGFACRAGAVTSIMRTIAAIKNILPVGHTLTAKAAFPINLADLTDAPPDVQVFGCDPSLDAYTGNLKFPNEGMDPMTHPLRYAGGHLHFGFCAGGVEDILYPLIIKLMDAYIGLPLAVIYSDSGQWQRRQCYGQAGEYRAQNYSHGRAGIPEMTGVEYRVPPAELFNFPPVTSLFMGIGRWVINNFNAKAVSESINERQYGAIREAINTGNGARALLQTLNLKVPDIINSELILRLADDERTHEFDYAVTGFETKAGTGSSSASYSRMNDGHFGWADYAYVMKWELDGKPIPIRI